MYINRLHRNKIKFVQYTSIFIDIYLIKEHFMFQYSVFYGEYENEKKTGTKNFNLHRGVFEPRIFEQVPTHNLNFEGD